MTLPPHGLRLALAVAARLACAGMHAHASEPDGLASVVMPASGTIVEGLPNALAARWEAEGTVIVGVRDARPVDRLLGLGDSGERRVTIEIRNEPCAAPPAPGSTSPWPTLGYAGIRRALPERRSLRSCKAPNLSIELRFPASTEADEEAILAAADRWEPVVAALHAAYGTTRIDLVAASALGAKLRIEAGADAPADLPTRLAAPLMLLDGRTVERGDALPWLVRALGGHDVLTLLAPTGAGLALQLLPFDRRFDCKAALEAALKSQAPPAPGTPAATTPPGWRAARAIGADRAAFCVEGTSGGLIAIGGARLPRAQWMPIALPMLARLAEAFGQRPAKP